MEISFKDIARIIKKNIIFVLIVSLLFSVCTFFYTSFFVKKTYTASVKLYVSADYNGNSANEVLSQYNYNSKLVATYIQMLDTNNFYTDVAKNFNNKYSASQIKSKIKFKSVENTEVFEASVVSNSPAEAKHIADAVAKIAPNTISKLLKSSSQLKIVDEATMPEKPTSPDVKKNVLIAFLIGLVLSLIVAFVRDFFDVKIKFDDELTTISGVPILAAIPDFEYFSNNRSSSKHTTQSK